MPRLRFARWGSFLSPSFDNVLAEAQIEVQEVTTEEELRSMGAGCDALFVRMPHHLSDELMSALPGLKVICVPGAGLEVIDLAAATARRIPVIDGRGIGARTVVEWTVASMLWLARDIGAMQHAITSASWETRHAVGDRRDLGALTIGVVGFGSIGRGVAETCRAGFGSRVIVTDAIPHVMDRAGVEGFEVQSLDQLLGDADIVTLHTQARHGEPPQIGTREIALMREGSFLVNTTRGAVLDYEALVRALDEGRLAGAAIDVYPAEPPPTSLVERLTAHRRVLLSPHQGGLTSDSVEALSRGVASAVVDVLRGGRSPNCANPAVWDA